MVKAWHACVIRPLAISPIWRSFRTCTCALLQPYRRRQAEGYGGGARVARGGVWPGIATMRRRRSDKGTLAATSVPHLNSAWPTLRLPLAARNTLGNSGELLARHLGQAGVFKATTLRGGLPNNSCCCAVLALHLVRILYTIGGVVIAGALFV